MGTNWGARRGQALMEVALGTFALALTVSMLTVLAVWMVKSLKMQNSVRTGPSSQSDTVEVGGFAAENLFGSEKIAIKEEVKMP